MVMMMVMKQNVAIYDKGDKKPKYENGILYLTSHRLLWREDKTIADSTWFIVYFVTCCMYISTSHMMSIIYIHDTATFSLSLGAITDVESQVRTIASYYH